MRSAGGVKADGTEADIIGEARNGAGVAAPPSLSRGLAVNFAAQIYATAVGVVVVPVYLRFMSVEVYGLIGFFLVLQAWFNLLDAGLSATMARETARFQAGSATSLQYRRVARGLQILFLAAGLAGGGVLLSLSDMIALRWLGDYSLPVDEVTTALRLMAVGVVLRWLSGLYRGIVTGAERQTWLSGFTALIATLRFLGAVPVIMFVDGSAATFFSYQLVVAGIELFGLLYKAHTIAPTVAAGERIGWSLRPIATPLRLAGMIALSAALGASITQTDKLILSSSLPLADYGHFTLAIVAANAILLIGVPVSAALMPRMAALQAAGREAELITAYRATTQLVAILSASVAFTLVFTAEPLLRLWTGDAEAARRAAPILMPYALGNAVYTLAAFPYYLQYAKGNLRLHLIGTAIFAIALVPAIVVAANQYGAIGTGWTWLGINILFLIAWLPFVHSRIASGLNRKWFGEDVLPIVLATGLAAGLAQFALPTPAPVFLQLGAIALFGAICLSAAIATSSSAREVIAWRR